MENNENIELLKKFIGWADEKKAENIIKLEIAEVSNFADAILVCSGTGDLHVKAIAENILEKAKAEKILLAGKEGFDSGDWILLDFHQIIVHIFREEIREQYDLEGFWKERIKLYEERNHDKKNNQE
ncbi:MAG: ribosome silencing factor [Candidatus Cloacimonadota bacterium]|nr:MAG: ribosome silencing factor [Candidatus Cloacimonadota bacterium]